MESQKEGKHQTCIELYLLLFLVIPFTVLLKMICSLTGIFGLEGRVDLYMCDSPIDRLLTKEV